MSEEANLDEFVSTEDNDEGGNFKQTAAGKIPIDWSTTNVEQVCDLRNGEATNHGDIGTESYPVYGSNGPIGSYSEPNFDGGLIFGRVGAVGEVERVTEPVWVSDNAIQARVLDEINAEFLYYSLSSRELSALATKTAQPLLNQSTIGNVSVPTPPLEEQRKIASVLYNIDQAIQNTEELASKTERIRNGVLQTRIIGDNLEESKKEGVLGNRGVTIPHYWENPRLGDIADVVSGYSLPKEYQDDTRGDYAVYKVEDMNHSSNHKYMSHSDNWLDQSELDELNHKVRSANTLILPKVGAALLTNKRRLLTEPASFDNNIMGWIPDDSIDPEFLYYASLLIDMEAVAQKGAVPSISKSIAMSLKIPLPPKEEQSAIAGEIQDIDDLINQYRHERDQLQEVKEGLMRDLLSGTVRTTDTNIEVVPEVAAHG